MTRLGPFTALVLALTACSPKGGSTTAPAAEPSPAAEAAPADSAPAGDRCQAALEHLADVAATGASQIPRDRYLEENAGMLDACKSWSAEKIDCVMTMTDISGDEWKRCS